MLIGGLRYHLTLLIDYCFCSEFGGFTLARWDIRQGQSNGFLRAYYGRHSMGGTTPSSYLSVSGLCLTFTCCSVPRYLTKRPKEEPVCFLARARYSFRPPANNMRDTFKVARKTPITHRPAESRRGGGKRWLSSASPCLAFICRGKRIMSSARPIVKIYERNGDRGRWRQ